MRSENHRNPISIADSQNNNMKFFCVLTFIACFIAVVLSQRFRTVSDNHCPLACARNYVPVCGMRLEKGAWKKEIFPNECEMQDENECHNGNYVPCTQ
ncbi:uncharacterized protein [Halyomorpha halys]|uniref:uncharacterized protein isoform X1 n=1 Tax=Halyomorpha halys TaxID=286706 RepID=UPI0034D189B1